MMIKNIKFPPITMELYETDIQTLQKFIKNEKKEGAFTEEYLILYNFAEDCRYSENIQPELVRYLLPFYFKIMEQAVLYENKIAVDIYSQFNSAIFFNQKNFEKAIGEKNYQYIMEYYINLTIKSMEVKKSGMLDWVSLFNTTVAFANDNIQLLFQKIFEGSQKVKYSFFQYLSVLLFEESDNLLVMNEGRGFGMNDIWDFDNGYFSNDFFWSDAAVAFFDKEITREKMEALFHEINPFLCNILDSELVKLFCVEMNQSFTSGVFSNRKAEYLKKISSKSSEYTYWDTGF